MVIASHIWKHKTKGVGLDKFNLTINDINHPRNGILMLKDIEVAFDTKQLCFLYNPFEGIMSVKVLNPNILQKTISSTDKTFSDIDGKTL